jgi:hypothetical protein
MSASVQQHACAVLVCHPDPSVSGTAEFTFWADLAEARQARDELTPCGPLCAGAHSIARLDLEPNSRCWLLSQTRTTSTAGGVKP